MDHDRGGLVDEKRAMSQFGGMPRPMIVRMRNEPRAKAPRYARKKEDQLSMALGYACCPQICIH